MRTPAVPQEFDDGDEDRETNAGDHPEYRDTNEANDRQPELPALDAIDPPEVGDLDQADGGGDDDGSERRIRQVLQQVRRDHEQQGDCDRTDDVRQLGAGAGGLGHRRARGAAADREALEETGCQIGGAKPHHLLVWVDTGAGSRRKGAREDAGVGERNHCDGKTTDHHRNDVACRSRGR